MIERKRANFILNEAKNVDIPGGTARLFNEVQDKICRLKPIDGILDSFLAKLGRARIRAEEAGQVDEVFL